MKKEEREEIENRKIIRVEEENAMRVADSLGVPTDVRAIPPWVKARDEAVYNILAEQGHPVGNDVDIDFEVYRNNYVHQANGSPELRVAIDIYAILMNMPDISVFSYEEVSKRFNDYIALCSFGGIKPTMAGLQLALGLSHTAFWQLRTGNIPPRSRLVKVPLKVRTYLKNVFIFMQSITESLVLDNKIHPTTSIFYLKNNFGYTDVRETIITPNTDQTNEIDLDEIEKRYKIEDE